MCFFIGYFCLLIIMTNIIAKANDMIVNDTKPVKSNLIIENNISTIRLTSSSYVGGKPHLLISFPIFIVYYVSSLKTSEHVNFYL